MSWTAVVMRVDVTGYAITHVLRIISMTHIKTWLHIISSISIAFVFYVRNNWNETQKYNLCFWPKPIQLNDYFWVKNNVDFIPFHNFNESRCFLFVCLWDIFFILVNILIGSVPIWKQWNANRWLTLSWAVHQCFFSKLELEVLCSSIGIKEKKWHERTICEEFST